MSWGKILPVPNSYFTKFSRWNELSVMRNSRDYRELQELVRDSLDPDRIRAFLSFLDADAGYAMYRAVSAAKMQLSHRRRRRAVAARRRRRHRAQDHPLRIRKVDRART